MIICSPQRRQDVDPRTAADDDNRQRAQAALEQSPHREDTDGEDVCSRPPTADHEEANNTSNDSGDSARRAINSNIVTVGQDRQMCE